MYSSWSSALVTFALLLIKCMMGFINTQYQHGVMILGKID